MQLADEQYMLRALQLAEKGRGTVSPNPMVGCVIVHEGVIIGEGWHQRYGQAHAEVNAVESVQDKDLLSASTCYVTLEPCAHYGQTPPCADLLVKHQLKRVVVAVKDTNPLVGGKGITKMQAAGIEVNYGLLEQDARKLNARFFTSIEKSRPFILLKWAETADGFVARKNFDSKWISTADSRLMVHQWRADEDAIMVGTNTARYDDPQLNVRGVKGNDPVRVVVDRYLKLSRDLKLFDGSQPTLCYNLLKDEEQSGVNWVKLPESGFLEALLVDMHQRKIQSVLVEGGSFLLNQLIEKGIWDEARVFKSPASFGEGIGAPVMTQEPNGTTIIDQDQLCIYVNPEPK